MEGSFRGHFWRALLEDSLRGQFRKFRRTVLEASFGGQFWRPVLEASFGGQFWRPVLEASFGGQFRISPGIESYSN